MWPKGNEKGPTDAECLAIAERQIAGFDAETQRGVERYEADHKERLRLYHAHRAAFLENLQRTQRFYASRVNKAA